MTGDQNVSKLGTTFFKSTFSKYHSAYKHTHTQNTHTHTHTHKKNNTLTNTNLV